MDIIQERHPALKRIGLRPGSECIDGDEGTARVQMRYDGCQALDLQLFGDPDGIRVAGNGSKIDHIGSCFEQVVRM